MRTFRIFATACAGAFVLAVSSSLGQGAEAAPGAFEEAAHDYDAGKFVEARQAYDSLVDSGNYSANLFFDLGNTWFRLGDPGRAILNYERALALEPGHPEARANLAFVREQTGAQIGRRTWLDDVTAPIDVNGFTLAAAAAAWVIVFAIAAMWWLPNRPLLWTVVIAGFLVLGCAGAGIATFERDKSLAIVTDKQAEARLEPLDNSGVAETLPSGSRVKILSDRGPWLYCSLPDDARGWVPSKSVEKIRLTHS